MLESFEHMVKIHLSKDLENTLIHLLGGFTICLLVLLITLRPWIAFLTTAVIAAIREFAYQYPLKDQWHLKAADRILDIAELALGALIALVAAYLILRFHAYTIRRYKKYIQKSRR